MRGTSNLIPAVLLAGEHRLCEREASLLPQKMSIAIGCIIFASVLRNVANKVKRGASCWTH